MWKTIVFLFVWLGSVSTHCDAAEEPNGTASSDAAAAKALAGEHLKRGTEKYYRNEYAEALKDIEAALKLAPDEPAIISARGMARSALKDFEGAHTDFKRALHLQPGLATLYYNRGLARRRTGDFYGSIAEFNFAIALQPDYMDAYNSRGNTMAHLREYVDAFVDYTRALYLNPRFANAYMNRSLVSRQMGNYSSALVDAAMAVELHEEKNPVSLLNRGRLYIELKDYDRAIADLNRATELKPELSDPYIERGRIELICSDFEKALKSFTRGIELEPDFAANYLHRAAVFEALNDPARAAADYLKAAELEQSPRMPEIQVYALLHLNCLLRRSAGASKDEHLSERGIGDYDWPSPIGAFLLGKRPATALLADAARRPWVVQQRGAECEALYFIAMDHLLEGRKDLAISFFQRCIDTGLESSMEHLLAKIRMRELR